MVSVCRGRSAPAAPTAAALLLPLIALAVVSTGSEVAGNRQGNGLRELYGDVLRRAPGSAAQLQTVLEQQPYVSVVLVMRNDDYGGNLLHRFERAIADLAEAALRHGLHYELVVVEWNPPPARPRLREAVRWPALLLDVRVITVPENLHAQAACRGWEYEAKNLGVSLARGKFVLASNCDIILADALISFLAAQTLRQDSFYRANRHDCVELVPPYLSAREVCLFLCVYHIMYIYIYYINIICTRALALSLSHTHTHVTVRRSPSAVRTMCVCVCVCARARTHARACMSACVHTHTHMP